MIRFAIRHFSKGIARRRRSLCRHGQQLGRQFLCFSKRPYFPIDQLRVEPFPVRIRKSLPNFPVFVKTRAWKDLRFSKRRFFQHDQQVFRCLRTMPYFPTGHLGTAVSPAVAESFIPANKQILCFAKRTYFPTDHLSLEVFLIRIRRSIPNFSTFVKTLIFPVDQFSDGSPTSGYLVHIFQRVEKRSQCGTFVLQYAIFPADQLES